MTEEATRPPLADLTSALDDAHTLDQASWIAVEYAISHLESDFAGVTLHDTVRGHSEAVAVSGALVAELHAVRVRLGEGPGAVPSGAVVTVPDTHTDQRWPAWSAAVAGLGVRSVRVYGMPELGGRAATLDLYSRTAGTSAELERSLDRDLIGAGHIGLALRLIARIAHLEEGMRTREVIGQAQGIVMERHGLSASESMAFLRRASQQSQIKVRDLASELTALNASADGEQGVSRGRSSGGPR